uniref:Nuclease associated modular domain-containing protein n=1 Tax=Pseudo-nitzschia delicatissima TaxID=44447 RepID=A0A7S0XLY2_9STRA|mmetsp:Transcript_351/g.749  ORF Transcript_351/g.749 Transcript_351/m.749 type:complete len:621 (+) Transcript_351:148-2010(+)
MTSKLPRGKYIRKNRRHESGSRRSSFHTEMMHFLVLAMGLFLVDFRQSSLNYSEAFVIRECNSILRQRHDQKTITYYGHYGHGGRDVCRSVPETSRGIGPCISASFHSKSSRSTILFESTVTDQDLDRMVSQEQTAVDSRNNIQSKPAADVSSIEVVIPNIGTKSTESLSPEKATSMSTDDKATLLGTMKKMSVEKDGADVPQPTANGGFSHTKSSRAKISAANKGRTPWNKGKPRSPEVKARIAAGVRAKNRQVFLKKLEDMGMTEAEYEAKKKEEKRLREADRRARRTENGGYRPTEETRKKISRILKEKHARGEVKKRSKTDPTKVRKGFTHSEETRRKISQSLRKRWQTDEGYQKKMKESINSRESSRKRISESLKKKWQDPEFRRGMMEKMAKRKSGKNARNYDEEHRKKISEAMKRKWKDASYREKTLSSIKKSAESRKVTSSPKKAASPSRTAKTKLKSTGIEELKPITATDVSKRKETKKRATRKRPSAKKKGIKDDDDDEDGTLVEAVNKPKIKGVLSSTKPSSTINLSTEEEPPEEKKKKKKKEKDGSVTRLREERRDLFDLLYGDEDDMNDDGDDRVGKLLVDSSSSKVDMLLGDEDLDAFDPYGLDDY